MKLGAVAAVLALFARTAVAEESYDVVVYGGTSGGVIAAVQAGRMGKRVVLIEPTRHLGGMTSGGLGATDMGNQAAIGGVAREFYGRIQKYYADPAKWKSETPQQYAKREPHYHQKDAQFGFEPHAAEETYNAMAAEANVKVVYGERLDLNDGVKKDGARVTAIKMESGRTFAGKEFIDATYEGDLMAKAGASYTVGREANSRYGETLNGVQVGHSKSHQFSLPVDSFVKAGDPTSGLLPYVHAGSPGKDGDEDRRQQAYNYRLCLTDVKDNQVPFEKPEGYREQDFELLLRYYDAGFTGTPWGPRGMPNRKTDTNNSGAFSTDFIGMNNDYPEADYAARDKIVADHVRYTKGLLWTLANHPRVPEKVRAGVSRWGWARDEFTDNGHFPRQLYVREARRMVGAYVMTESDIVGKRKPEDPVGLGSYGMDSHNTQRYVDDAGHARNEGDVQVHGFSPYGISYRSLVPKEGQVSNLLVPICMSATHIAYGSIRMEPVYMILGQACGTAACLAIDAGADVQKIEYARLKDRLLADKQLIEWTGPTRTITPAIRSADLPGVVIDDTRAKLTGDWKTGSYPGVDGKYQHDLNEAKGHKSARFDLRVPSDGKYEIRFAYVANANRASNVPVTVESAGGKKLVKVNEKKPPVGDKSFVSLGVFDCRADSPVVVTVSNEGTDGYVVIDAVQAVTAKVRE